MRITYEHELEELNKCLRDMAMMVEKAMEQTLVAFEDQNYTMAEDVIKGDRNVNDMERAIESRCLSLILRQQPVAKDLRQISTALKVVTDLERIGDHASDIAELILRIKSDHAYHIVQHLPAMAASAQKMVHDAVEAFIKQDVEEAEEIIRRDDEVDALFNQVKTAVVELLKSSPSHADKGIDLLMIATYLERIGDHAMNLAGYAKDLKEWNLSFSDVALEEIEEMKKQCLTALDIVKNEEGSDMTQVLFEASAAEQKIDDLRDKYFKKQMQRMKKGKCKPQSGIIFTEMLTDFERMGDHVKNIAQQYKQMSE